MYDLELDEQACRYYEFDFSRTITEDREFFRRLARECPGPILECACGSGRLAMPLALDGHRITGLDNAPAMLRVFREKIEAAADPELAGRVRLVEADMRDFDLGATFGLVFIGWNSIMHLQTIDDQLAFLRCAKRHLAPEGTLAIDIFNPDFGYLLEGTIQSREHVGEYPPTGRSVWRSENAEIDAGSQLVHLRLGYLEEGAPPEEERVIQTTLRYFFRYEMEHLIARAGLELRRLIGEYDGSPYKSGAERLLCLAGHAC